jgi:hypothetical protein
MFIQNFAVAAIAVTTYALLWNDCSTASNPPLIKTQLSQNAPSLLQTPPTSKTSTASPKVTSAPSQITKDQVVFILDSSGSMAEKILTSPRFMGMSRWEVAGTAIREWLDRMSEDVEVGFAPVNGQCGQGAVNAKPVGMSRDTARQVISSSPFGGGSNIHDVLLDIPRLYNSNYEGEKRAILLTDGEDVCGKVSACEVAKTLHQQHGIKLDIVSFVMNDPDTLSDYQCAAQNSEGRYIEPTSLSDLVDMFDILGYLTPWRYLVLFLGCLTITSTVMMLYRHMFHVFNIAPHIAVLASCISVGTLCASLWLMLFASQGWLGVLVGSFPVIAFGFYVKKSGWASGIGV